MRILFLGDIVGTPGIQAVRKIVPIFRVRERIDCVIVNAENATNGSGLSPKDYKLIRSGGVDAITLGDHIYKKLEITNVLQNPAEPICKPANYPSTAPGRDHVVINLQGVNIAVISLLGRTFTRPVDCPYTAVDRVLNTLNNSASIIIVDMHAEATADKYLMGHHLDGRVSAVLGTHTHVQTADEQLLPKGTAFLCDAGMCGPYESVLGRRIDRLMTTTLTFVPTPFDVATGDPRIAGAIVDVDHSTGKANSIKRVMIRESEV